MTAAPWNLVTLAPLPPAMANEVLGDLPLAVVAPDRDDQAAIRAALADAELLIYDWRASATGLTAEDIAAAPHLAFVQQPSVGVPGHDIAALDAAGVALANAAGFNAVAVAEWVLGALFGVARHLTWVETEAARRAVAAGGRDQSWSDRDRRATCRDRRLRPHRPRRRRPTRGIGLHGVVLVAVRVAIRSTSTGATYRDLDEMIATSDVLINLIALGDETRGLLSASRLAALPAGALVVSASRGGIVDEVAVLEAVERGHLAGAAFDVYDTEPLPADSPLRRCDRILLSSHTAGTTQESFARMTALLTDNIRRAVTGQPVHNVVNAADPVVRRR